MIFVYILPEERELSDGFCKPEGNPITFQNVDWFNTPDELGQGGPMTEDDLVEFIQGKNYYHPTLPFLVIDTFDCTRTFIIPVDD